MEFELDQELVAKKKLLAGLAQTHKLLQVGNFQAALLPVVSSCSELIMAMHTKIKEEVVAHPDALKDAEIALLIHAENEAKIKAETSHNGTN